jgi:hypothetical protein
MKTLAPITCLCTWLACSNDPGATGNDTPDAAMNCEGRADDYFAGMKKTTSDGSITAELVSAEPAPPANADNNTWMVKLSTSSGTPITGAVIVGAPYMIDHRHGAPNQMSTETGSGSYRLGPLALRMAGLWTITLEITPQGEPAKTVVFSFCIPND